MEVVLVSVAEEEEAMIVARTVAVAIMVLKISTIFFTIRMSPTATVPLPNAAGSADGWTRGENTDLVSRIASDTGALVRHFYYRFLQQRRHITLQSTDQILMILLHAIKAAFPINQ